MMFFGRALFFTMLMLATGLVTARRVEMKRQTTGLPGIPPSCSEVCSVFTTLLANIDPALLCTSTNGAAIQSCSNCILLIGGNTVLNNEDLMNGAQRSANSFVAACNAASHPIPNILVANPVTQSTAAAGPTAQSSSNDAYVGANLLSMSTVVAAGFLSTIISFI